MRAAFKMMTTIDRDVASIGFMAVYNANIERGLSRADAVSEASRAVFMTQNATHAKDKPLLWRQNSFVRAAMMFTGDAAKRWNIATYDLVRSFRNGGAPRVMYIALSLALEAAMTKTIRDGDPDDGEGWAEWAADATAQDALSSIPLVGGEAVDLYNHLIRGKRNYSESSVFFAPMKEAAYAIKNLAEGEYEKAIWNALNVYAHGFTSLTHYPVPVTALKRGVGSIRALSEGDVKSAFSVQIGRWPEKKTRRRGRRRASAAR
jgi:hypothetical protein